ncbi:MAG: hypothetical protein V7638_2500 [Acidobacteriota bacterium]|jgi:hypothetical protein
MIRNLLAIFVLQWSVVSSSILPAPQTFTVREENVYAPRLYADTLNFVATLVNLPGVNQKQSYWELSYQLYFVPEDKYYEALQRAPRGPSNPTPEEFPGRMLLTEGHIKKTRLATLQDRTITFDVPFKQRIPDAKRTKFAHLMTAYSMKIFDAELNTTVYSSGLFLTEPYEPDPRDEKQATARKTIYLSFGINPNGSLNRSQLPPKLPGSTRNQE